MCQDFSRKNPYALPSQAYDEYFTPPEPVTDLKERIARRICTLNPQVKSWDELDVFAQGAWLGEVAGLLALIKPEIDAARQEGRQEVAEWGNEVCNGHGSWEYSLYRRQCSQCWQAYCKELGIPQSSKGDYRKARGVAPRPPGAPPPEETIGKSRGG